MIAHKVSHCSKNQAGADAFAAFTSLAQTTLKNGNTSVTAAFRLLFSACKSSSVETPSGRPLINYRHPNPDTSSNDLHSSEKSDNVNRPDNRNPEKEKLPCSQTIDGSTQQRCY